jgi:hypothetical protein
MATSGASEGGFSGRAGFVLRFEVRRISVVNSTTNRFHAELRAINRSGYTSYDLTARPFSVGGSFQGSGSWVPDFRNGTEILLWAVDANLGTDGNGNSTFTWSASAGPAGIFGTASTSGSFGVDRILQVPDAPPQADLNSRTSTSVTIGLPQPGDNGGSTVIDYTFQLDNASGFTSPYVSKTVSPGSRTQTVTGLSPNSTYYVRHRARNSVGSSGWSSTLTVKTLADEPSAPLNPHTQDPGPSSLTVDWDVPSTNNGAAITSYIVQRATNSSMSSPTEFSVDDSVTQKTFTDLQPSTQYWFRVIAVNSVGRSPASSTVTGTTISGAYVSNGSAWKGAGVFVSDGTAWTPATIAADVGGAWINAV